jgi:hypothetical protein
MSKVLFLSGRGDLAIDRTLPVNQVVEMIKTCKSGLIQVRDGDGDYHSVPKSNLDVEEVCTCDCHIEGHNVMHCMPCCDFTYEKYITEDNRIIADKLSALLIRRRRNI